MAGVASTARRIRRPGDTSVLGLCLRGHRRLGRLTAHRLAVRAPESDPLLGRGATILITGIAWFALGLAVALARDLSLAAYLIKIFLPSSPALLDCTDLARSHWRHATRREHADDLHRRQRAW